MSLVMIAATIVLSAVGALAPFVAVDLNLSPTQLGLLISLYSVMAATSSIPLGSLADSLDKRIVTSAIFLAAAMLLVLIAVAKSYFLLAGTMLIAGCIEALGNPITNRMIREAIPVGRRGSIVGIKQSGAVFSLALAGFILAPLAGVLGWRRALFIAAAAIGASVVPVLRRNSMYGQPESLHSDILTAKPLPRTFPHRGIAMFALFMGMGDAVIIGQLPFYLHSEVGLSATAAGLSAGVVGVFAVIGRLFWAKTAESRNDIGYRLLGKLAGIALIAIVLLKLFVLQHEWIAWLIAAALGFSALSWNAVAMLTVISAAEAGRLGRRTGEIMAGFLSGAAIGPVLFGVLVEQTRGYESAWTYVTLVYAAASGIAIVKTLSQPLP